jgi:hypothetical protein
MSRHWNYRVLEFATPDGEVWRAIHEVHYDDGKPVCYSVQPAVVLWDVEEGSDAPAAILERMREAVSKPVLTVRDFPASPGDT